MLQEVNIIGMLGFAAGSFAGLRLWGAKMRVISLKQKKPHG